MKNIKQRLEGMKLNTKFTIAILVLVAVPLLIFMTVFFQYTRKSMVNQTAGEEKRKIAEDYGDIRKMAEICSMSSQVFLSDQELSDLLLRIKDRETITAAEYMEFAKGHLSLLESLVNSNPYLYQIRVYAKSNDFPEMLPLIYHEERIEDAPWKDSSLSGAWQFDYKDFLNTQDSGEHLMALVDEIEDPLGESVGILETAVSMKNMFPRIYDSNDENWSCFVGENGTVYSSGSEEASVWEKEKEKIVKAVGDLEESRTAQCMMNGNQVLIVSQPVPELSGTYISLVNTGEQMKEMKAQQAKILWGMAALILLLAVVVNETVRLFLSRFYEVLAVVHNIRKGNLDERIQTGGSDEIGELGGQINRMLDRIQVLMKENADSAVLIKNTEIKALQNQINAHFIYNVLECIKMMAEIDEKYEISDAVTSLGELLRYNMKWVSGNVTIREEVAYIKNYIQLMNLRYDFTIILSIKIPEEIYRQKIPKMSLQPIVENAIVHGIVEMGEDATIYIKAVMGETDYEISITDSGLGMNEEQMHVLEMKMRGEVETSGGSGNGIGLKNVQDRIQIQFGSEYGLKFHSKEGCFTKVSVHLPYERK